MIEPHHQLVANTAKGIAEKGKLRYLEIGVNEGGSVFEVFRAAAVHLAVLVDTWGKESGGTNRGSPERVCEVLREYLENCLIITGDSAAVLPSLTYKFNLIFVDGDHSPAGCLRDMINAKRLLEPGGTMIVDDTCHPQHTYIKSIVAKFAADNGMSVKFDDSIHFGVAILK